MATGCGLRCQWRWGRRLDGTPSQLRPHSSRCRHPSDSSFALPPRAHCGLAHWPSLQSSMPSCAHLRTHAPTAPSPGSPFPRRSPQSRVFLSLGSQLHVLREVFPDPRLEQPGSPGSNPTDLQSLCWARALSSSQCPDPPSAGTIPGLRASSWAEISRCLAMWSVPQPQEHTDHY